MLSLPQSEEVRNLVGSNTEIGKRLERALNYTWTTTEKTVLDEE